MEEVVLPPYKSGYLPVGSGHEIYYECCGNPNGKPILYIHGGPGAGFSEGSKKWFDPKLWNIILFDQRGCGRSKPFASLSHNTTDDLAEDMNKLLDFLKIERVTLFGGSWGSTLSLVYAIRNPQRVQAMILRGIFIPSKEDNRYVYGGDIENFFPEVWQRFIALVPQDKRQNAETYYAEKMHNGTEKEKNQYMYEWTLYEESLLKLRPTAKTIKKEMDEFDYRSIALLETHYFMNNCFLPENYILDNAPGLSHIPTILIQGRYDMICRSVNAYRLHKKIAGSKLVFTIAGHSSSDAANKRALLKAVKEMYPLV